MNSNNIHTIASIPIAGLITKVQQLSRYEGRGAYTAAGDSDFENVQITDQDAEWVRTFAIEGAQLLIARLMPLADSSEIKDEGGGVIEIKASNPDLVRTNIQAVERVCKETLCAYIMRQWCSEHKVARVAFYDSLFNDSVQACVVTLRSKRKPSFSDFNDD